VLSFQQFVFGTSFFATEIPGENDHSIEVSAPSMTKSRGSSAGMRIAFGHHHELTIASVDENRKEEVEMVGKIFGRGFHNQPTGVVLK
jgi:hypothetical protein